MSKERAEKKTIKNIAELLELDEASFIGCDVLKKHGNWFFKADDKPVSDCSDEVIFDAKNWRYR